MNAKYFDRFPKRRYDVRNSGEFETITDISRNVKVNLARADEALTYTYETIHDGERPDVFSFRLYGTTAPYWTFFVINDSLREGLRDSWPMSSNSFENMMIDEYDVYSVFTLLPKVLVSGVGEVSSINDISVISFDPEYIPYLVFTGVFPTIGEVNSRIRKYDSSRFQLWVSDIEDISRFDSSTPETQFNVRWVNPYEFGSTEHATNRDLQIRWMEHVIALIAITDPRKYSDYQDTSPPTNSAYDPEQFDTLEWYVCNGQYATLDFWASARNAPASYYDGTDGTVTISAYDALTLDPSNPNAISYYTHELDINNAKSSIRVVRPDLVGRFIAEYFELINGQ